VPVSILPAAVPGEPASSHFYGQTCCVTAVHDGVAAETCSMPDCRPDDAPVSWGMVLHADPFRPAQGLATEERLPGEAVDW
jgi:hypothetical protein